MWGISRGFILIQDGGSHSRNDFWEHFGKSVVFVESVSFVIQINKSINLGMGLEGKRFSIEMPTTLCFAAPLRQPF